MTAGDSATADESLDVITDSLLTASRLLVAITARSIAQIDETITIPQLRTLVILSYEGPINLVTLAGLLGVERSTTGRMVDRLVDAGLIDRRAHPHSRRDLLVQLTPRGSQIVQQVTANRRTQIARIVARMPPIDRQDLVRALTALSTAAREPAVGSNADSIDRSVLPRHIPDPGPDLM